MSQRFGNVSNHSINQIVLENIPKTPLKVKNIRGKCF